MVREAVTGDIMWWGGVRLWYEWLKLLFIQFCEFFSFFFYIFHFCITIAVLGVANWNFSIEEMFKFEFLKKIWFVNFYIQYVMNRNRSGSKIRNKSGGGITSFRLCNTGNRWLKQPIFIVIQGERGRAEDGPLLSTHTKEWLRDRSVIEMC